MQSAQALSTKYDCIESNWAGNIRFNAQQVHRPKCIEAVQDLVRTSNRIRALGQGYSFSSIADTDGYHLSLRDLNQIELIPESALVQVEAGITYDALNPYLHCNGYALSNLASFPNMSVIGACTTGTHGSGDSQCILGSTVTSVTKVRSDGQLCTYKRREPGFEGAVVDLGLLGITVELELKLIPSFSLQQYVYEKLPFECLSHNLLELMALGYSVSVFTDWEHQESNQIWMKGPLDNPAPMALFGATKALTHRHPLPGLSASSCTPQLGELGPWHERLPHFLAQGIRSSGCELQSEYFVSRQDAPAAIEALRAVRSEFSRLVQLSELRSVAADRFWLSPCYGRDSIGIHFTWHNKYVEVKEVLQSVIEPTLDRYTARAHWGKLFTVNSIRKHYPKADDFLDFVRRNGDRNKFGNEFTARCLD